MLTSKPSNKQNSDLEQKSIIRNIVTKYIRGSETLPPPLSREEEIKYTQLLSEGSLEARQILIERNLRFVVHIAKRFVKANIDIEDIISVGTIGLIKAVNTYKMDKDTRLVTYASRCINNEILMYFRKLNKSTEISFDELLDTGNDDGRMISDVLGTDTDMIEAEVESGIDKELLHQAIEKLPVEEREIIILRFGLSGHKVHTQAEVAEKLGTSQSYISRLEKRIFSRLGRVIKG